MDQEKSPLLRAERSGAAHGPWWQCWRPESPNFRFLVLFALCFMPLGPHVIKHCLSSLKPAMMADKKLDIDHAEFGALMSAVSVPNLFIPLFGGLFLDLQKSRWGTLFILSLTTIGHTMFTLAIAEGNYPWALAGRALFGLGQGSAVVAQGAICAHWFTGWELTFAVGLAETSHSLASWLAKVYVVHIPGPYINALWVGVGISLLSFFSGLLFFYLEWTAERHGIYARPGCSRLHGVQVRDFATLSISFWLLCALHMLFSNCSHLFSTISTDFIVEKWHTKVTKAAWISGLEYGFAMVLAPVVGLFVDGVGGRMYLCAMAGAVYAASYLVLGYTHLWPVTPILVLAVMKSFVPTVLRASVPLVVAPCVVGTAYGLYEICEAIGSMLGHPLVGFLRDTSHGYAVDMLVFAIMATVACFGCLFLSWLDCYGHGVLNAKEAKVREYMQERARREAEEDQAIAQKTAYQRI